MSDTNKTILVGRLTRDPEFKTINGNSFVQISIANGRKYKSNGETKEETNFLECQAWGKLSEIINQYAKKGSQVCIEGRIKQERWEKDGKKNSRIIIVIENLQLLGGKKDGQSQGNQAPESFDQMGEEVEDYTF
jgi:single-strand DNA-binding protein